MPSARHRQTISLSVRRFKSPLNDSDSLLSPFILDPSQLTLPAHRNQTRHKAIWLHTPVTVRHVSSRTHALQSAYIMSNLRHPNLEQLLGVVVDPQMSCVVTEWIPGSSLSKILASSASKRSKFVCQYALSLALDIARALLYLHAASGQAHGAVSPAGILFDDARCRAILQMSGKVETSPPCAAPEASKIGTRLPLKADVYSLAATIKLMFGGERSIPKALRRIVVDSLQNNYRVRPCMEELCQAIMNCIGP